MYKTHDKAVINCKNMAIEAGLIQVFSTRTVLSYWFLLCFYAFYCISLFRNFQHKKVFSMKFCEFHFLSKFCEFFLFSISRKTGDSNVHHTVVYNVQSLFRTFSYHSIIVASYVFFCVGLAASLCAEQFLLLLIKYL